MDLDDIFKALIPKSKRKKLKKKLKKKNRGSLLKQLFTLLFAFFANQSQPEQSEIPQKQSTYTDRREERKPREFAEKRDKQGPLQENLRQAHTYLQNIDGMVQTAEPDSMKRLRLEQVHGRVAEWVHMIEGIVTHVETQSDDQLIAAERKRVPAAIKRLEKDLEKEKDPTLRAKLERTLGNRRKQLAQIEQSGRNRQMAELKVENTLAQIGIIYTQLHSGNFIAQTSNYDRLSAEINDEILSLSDYLDTLGELRQNSTHY